MLVDDAPEGDDWLHELKFDGYRIGVRIDDRKVALLSRRAKDWTEAFPTVVAGARKIDAKTALIDGELAGVLPDGRTSLHAMGGSNLAFFAFDLLHVDGEDLFDLPLDQRKLRLAALLGDAPPVPFRYVEHHVGDGARFFKEACAMRLEGIVSKARAAPYKSGARNASWRKVKCVLRQEFVMAATNTRWWAAWARCGSAPTTSGAAGFAGKVGTGFQREAPRDEEAGGHETPDDAVRHRRARGRGESARRPLGRAHAGVRGRVHGMDRPRPHPPPVVSRHARRQETARVKREAASEPE